MSKRTDGLVLSSQMIQNEIKRVKHKKNSKKIFRETVFSLAIVAAVAVLVAMLLFPTFRLTGSSMEPTLESNELVICVKMSKFKPGNIIVFYYNNKVLIKRVIGTSGDIIEISEQGDVYVNGVQLEEPYLTNKSLGNCDIEFPYQVPENRIFVMGDNRETSVDSRETSVGCIADEYIIGKVFLRVWPFDKISTLK